jgi:hypothetical protein
VIKKIVHIIMLSCRKATELIEKKLHQKLSRRERVQLKWHKSICDVCTLYEKQVVFLEKILQDDLTQTPAEQAFPAAEIESLQTRIIDSLNK